MKRLIVFLLVLTGFAANSFAQNLRLSPVVIPTQGKQTKVGNFALSWTVGESLNRTTRNGNLVLSEGFQQPIISYINIASTIMHKSSKHNGAIYLVPSGGLPPYRYEWSDLSLPDFDLEQDSILAKAAIIGLSPDSISFSFKVVNFLDRRVGIDTGTYNVVVRDSRGYPVSKSYRIGFVSKFLLTSNSLTNDSGVITKIDTEGWQNNFCVSTIPVSNYNEASFEFQVLDTGSFDFGFRDIASELLNDSLFDGSSFAYGSDEYYQILIRNGTLSYAAKNVIKGSPLTSVTMNDRISLCITNDQIIVKKNEKVYLTASRVSLTGRKVFTVARIYSQMSAFKILQNIVY